VVATLRQVEFEGSCSLKLQQLGEVYTISLPALQLLAPLAEQGAAAFKGEISSSCCSCSTGCVLAYT
jgi:hypothetical protein